MKSIDISGQRFGRLTAIERVEAYGGPHWRCRCDCGREVVARSGNLRSGNTESCGCLAFESKSARAKARARHGLSRTPTYQSWRSMLNRCTNEKCEEWARYGGCGIKVCDRWMRFDDFLADMGRRPSRAYTLDRVDNDRGYEPGNVRWADAKTQARNKRSVALNTVSVCLMRHMRARKAQLADIAHAFGVSVPTACNVTRRDTWGDPWP